MPNWCFNRVFLRHRDPALLRRILGAHDEKKLRSIYQEIDRLEKTRMKVTEHSSRTDEYFRPLLAGCALLFLSVLLGNTLLRTTP